MLVVSVRKSFTFSPGTLLRDAQRLLGALQDATFGVPVVAHLPATFGADFEAQIALVARLGDEQSGAIGSLGTFTFSQSKALADYVHLAFVARRAARLAFPGQDALLHGEFQVGIRGSRDIPHLLDRGRKLLAACRNHVAELAPHGLSAAGVDRLGEALETLAGIDREHAAADDGKQGLTAQRISAANALYRQCIAVQNAARLVYDGVEPSGDPATVTPRARFLLDEFPPRFNASPVVAPTVSPDPVVAAPAPAAVAS